MERREFLKFSSAFGLMATITGCTCPLPRKQLIEWMRPTRLTPLAPNQIQPKPISLAFDVHTHLFNATDVPVRGFLAESIGHSSGVLQPLIAAAAPVIEEISQLLAISCGEEMNKLADMISRLEIAPMSVNQMQDTIDSDIESHIQEIEKHLIPILQKPDSPFAIELDRADESYRSRFGLASTPKKLSQNVEEIGRILRNEDHLYRSQAINDFSGTLNFGPAGVLRFVKNMLSPRHHNLRTFQKACSTDNGAFGVDACFAALVDFDHWLGCPQTPSSIKDQILLHEQLAVLSGGYVLPIAPYNPWSDLKQPGIGEQVGSYMKLIQDAVLNRGFVGIKLYPPMGFYPLGNDKFSYPSDKSHPEDGALLDKTLRALYTWCQDNDVPIMAHTSHSNGRDDAHDEFSKPEAWQLVFNEFPKLRVNGGHFGGGFDAWPQEFVNIMKTEQGSGMFVDLAYNEWLLSPSSDRSQATARILVQQTRNGQTVLDNVMYGSDWLMLSMIDKWEEFPNSLRTFMQTLNTPDMHASLEKFYFKNAARCFGLYGGKSRDRLNDFYTKKWELHTPPWLTKLDLIGR